MTVKQVIVGTLLGAAAVATLIHRLPKSESTLALRPLSRQDDRNLRHTRSHRKPSIDERTSLGKQIG